MYKHQIWFIVIRPRRVYLFDSQWSRMIKIFNWSDEFSMSAYIIWFRFFFFLLFRIIIIIEKFYFMKYDKFVKLYNRKIYKKNYMDHHDYVTRTQRQWFCKQIKTPPTNKKQVNKTPKMSFKQQQQKKGSKA